MSDMADKKTKPAEPAKITILTDTATRAQLEQLAAEQNRSLSAQIVYMLKSLLGKKQ